MTETAERRMYWADSVEGYLCRECALDVRTGGERVHISAMPNQGAYTCTLCNEPLS